MNVKSVMASSILILIKYNKNIILILWFKLFLNAIALTQLRILFNIIVSTYVLQIVKNIKNKKVRWLNNKGTYVYI